MCNNVFCAQYLGVPGDVVAGDGGAGVVTRVVIAAVIV